jgi:hypothetical protein
VNVDFVVNDDIWENKLAAFRARGLTLMNLNQESCMKASSGNLKIGNHFSIFLMTQVFRRTFQILTYSLQFVKQNVEIPKRYPDWLTTVLFLIYITYKTRVNY